VDVSIKLDTLKQVTIVPREAINVGQNISYVFAIDGENKAQMHPVKVLYQDQTVAASRLGLSRSAIAWLSTASCG